MEDTKQLFYTIILAMALVASFLVLTGCDREQFKKDHPQAEAVLEEVAQGAEVVVEGAAESALSLPPGVLKPEFDYVQKKIVGPKVVAPAAAPAASVKSSD